MNCHILETIKDENLELNNTIIRCKFEKEKLQMKIDHLLEKFSEAEMRNVDLAKQMVEARTTEKMAFGLCFVLSFVWLIVTSLGWGQ